MRIPLLGTAATAAFAALVLSAPAHAAPCAAPFPTQTPEVDAAGAAAQGTLCETIGTSGRSDLTYQVKRNNVWATRTIVKPLTYRALRRQPGVAGTDEYASRATRRPVVLFVHGGAFVAGGRDDLLPYARLFARKGFVSVLPEYALVPQDDFVSNQPLSNQGTTLTLDTVSRSAQQDLQTTIRHLKSRATQLGIDPAQIYVVGYSAGAIAAIRTATRFQDDGTHSFRDVGASPAGSNQGGQISVVQGAVSISGVECYANHPLAVTIWPYTFKYGECLQDTEHIGDAPFVMLHGNNDTTLTFGWAQQTCTAYSWLCPAAGPTRYVAYNTSDNGKTGVRNDGSYGTCGNGTAGSDHFLSEPAKCPARAGITTAGLDGPSFQANIGKPAASVARQAYTAIKGWVGP